MAGETKMVQVAPGVEMTITVFTPDEMTKFDTDYPKVISHFTQGSVAPDKRHVISDWFDETVEVYKLIGQACKNDISPNAGVFQGMRATTGFGFSMIRPDYLVPIAQGRTYDATVVALVANNWYGLYHNAAIGAAYNAVPLYLRKELGIGIVGMLEIGADNIIEEMQWEINGKPLPVFDMVRQMVGSDFRAFRYPSVEYLKPAIQYRSQAKFAAAAGDTKMTPLGLVFATSDYLRNTVPVQPTIVAP